MAELPDLTVFAKTLTRLYKGKTLNDLEIKVAKKLNVTSAELKTALEGTTLNQVERAGKTLQFHFGKDQVLGLHLMLRGELKAISGDLPKHTILAFHFTEGKGFAVTDVLKQATTTLSPPIAKAPDALEITETEFLTLLSRRKKNIKEVLIDQKAFRGIGNSYADEILWEASISPLSIADKIPEKQAKKLFRTISKVLNEAIKAITKENGNELKGELRDFMKIHGAKIEKSPTGKTIRSEKIGGRTAYYTSEQKLYK